jgi:hypothetical protein
LSDEKLLRGIDARNNSIQELQVRPTHTHTHTHTHTTHTHTHTVAHTHTHTHTQAAGARKAGTIHLKVHTFTHIHHNTKRIVAWQVLLKEVAPDSYLRHGDTVLPSHLHFTRRSLSPAAGARSERHGVPSAHVMLSENESTRSVLSPRVSWTSAGGSGPTRLMGASGLEQQYQGPQSPGTVKNMFPSGSTRLMGTRGHIVSCDGPLGVANLSMQGENNVPDGPLVSVSPVSAGTDVLTEVVSPSSASSPLFQF